MKPHAEPPAGMQLVEIGKPVYGGAFLAKVEGKVIFVPLALPGEQARVRIAESKPGYVTAEVDEIVRAARERVEPACPHHGSCGGCHYQHTDPSTQLAFKQAILRETLERGGVALPDAIRVLAAESASQDWGYRNRIRMAFDEAGNPGYRGRRSHAVVAARECLIAAPLLPRAAQAFAEVARDFAPAFRPAEIALFCDPTESALLATVFTAAPGKLRFEELAMAFAQRIPELRGAEWVMEGAPQGRMGRERRTLARWGAAALDYPVAGFNYRVDHGAFFQANRWLLDALVERVATGREGTLAWDLFAGVGLFARRLTQSFRRVVAVESAPSAVRSLAANLKNTTGTPVRAETVEFLRRQTAKPSAAASSLDVVPDLIVVDPPRTGLGAECCALLARIGAPALSYVSCDPATLDRDLRALTGSGYRIQSIALVDLFPQTFHLETVVELRRP